jgi:hypothetical protein
MKALFKGWSFQPPKKSEDAAKMTFREVTGNDLREFLQQW